MKHVPIVALSYTTLESAVLTGSFMTWLLIEHKNSWYVHHIDFNINMVWFNTIWFDLTRLNLFCAVKILYHIKSYCVILYRSVYCNVLYCIVLYCIVLYCIVLYCIVLYCIVLYWIVLYVIVLYCIVLYCIVLYSIVLYCIAMCCIVMYCIVL